MNELEPTDRAMEAMLLYPPDVRPPLTYFSHGHTLLERCPGCGETGLAAVGLDQIAYTFETCTCGTPEYPHLVEQLWHRDHLAREGWAVAAGARREALAAVRRAVMAEVRRGERGAPSRQQLTYGGGLRRAGRVIDELLGEAADRERSLAEVAGQRTRIGGASGA